MAGPATIVLLLLLESPRCQCMKSLLTELELECVLIRFRLFMYQRMCLSIGLVNLLCSLSRIEVIVLLLMMRIERELDGCSTSFIFDLDKIADGDSLLIHIIHQEHLLLCISFPVLSVVLRLLKSNTVVELSDLIRRLLNHAPRAIRTSPESSSSVVPHPQSEASVITVACGIGVPSGFPVVRPSSSPALCFDCSSFS
ncbi:MAG: hypothetical protein EZS28_037402 [Streblomastix strix]|uniref:Secreted protein n=1 Tax=Streblomastix strix TaxID=222440 RepID=A0A5J4UA74_9EUKA|nr:MAG: hypothetical protein EZS28_037402 [Streblomastix strix]